MSLKKFQVHIESLTVRLLTLEPNAKSGTAGYELRRSISRLFTRLLIVLPMALVTGMNSEVFTILVDFYRDLTSNS
jgi:hypothetical protein